MSRILAGNITTSFTQIVHYLGRGLVGALKAIHRCQKENIFATQSLYMCKHAAQGIARLGAHMKRLECIISSSDAHQNSLHLGYVVTLLGGDNAYTGQRVRMDAAKLISEELVDSGCL